MPSNKNFVRCGAQQGSILAPLLYLIYVNDMYRCTNETTPVLFADDTTLLSFAKSQDDAVKFLNDDLIKVQEWLICNKLTLNSKKSKFIIFGRKRTRGSRGYKVVINNKEIEQVSSTKFLGLTINEKLSSKEHMNGILVTIQRNLGIIYKIRRCLNRNVLIQLYYS